MMKIMKTTINVMPIIVIVVMSQRMKIGKVMTIIKKKMKIMMILML